MRLGHVSIKNYRCLVDVQIPLDDYIAFIGPNGAGKSSILYALAWLFDKRDISAEDVNAQDPTSKVEVSVQISDLTPGAAAMLGRFGRNGCAQFTRTFDPSSGEATYVGRAHCGPGFRNVLDAGSISNIRSAYKNLRLQFPELPEPSSTVNKGEIETYLDAWESDPQNRQRLIALDDVDAHQVFVKDGPMSRIIQFVLVQGSTDLASQLGGVGRSSVLGTLIQKVVDAAKSEALESWKSAYSSELLTLEQSTSQAIEVAVGAHQTRVNAALKKYLPSAEISLSPSAVKITVTSDSPITTRFSDGKSEQDISHQGHGTQRAVMMSMIQALAEQGRSAQGDSLLVLAAEEPEIYQHPIRARHFARALSDLSKTSDAQVLVATHSPFFVRPEYLPSLRKIEKRAAGSTVHITTAQSIARLLGKSDKDVLRRMEQNIPTGFRDCFFSHCVVLVEGITDRLILEEVANLVSRPFDAAGITVFSIGSKTDFSFYYHILTSLGIATFVVFDGDFKSAERKYPQSNDVTDSGNATKRLKAHQSNCDQTTKCLKLLELLDANGVPTQFTFGDQSWIGDKTVIFHDCLEDELHNWPSFCTETLKLKAKDFGKDAFAYRMATKASSPTDMPDIFVGAINAIHKYAETHV